MISDEETTNYFGASTIVSGLKIEIMEAIWRSLGAEILHKAQDRQETYFKVNRDIGAALNNFIALYSVEQHIDKMNIPKEHLDRVVEHKTHNMAHQIADAIIKDMSTVVRRLESAYRPEIILKVEVPFLKLQSKNIKLKPKESSNE